MTIAQGLPIDVPGLISQGAGTNIPEAQNGPVMPGTSMPPAPLQQQPAPPAPEIGAPTLADKVAGAFMEHLAQNQPPPVRPRPPQSEPQASTGQRIMGAAEAAATGLGDMRTGGDPSKGHGWLSAVGATLNARNERLAQSQKDQVLLAKSQAEVVAMHRNFYQQDAEHREKFHEGNKAFFAPYSETNDIENGVSQDVLYKRMQDDPKFTQEYLARATGEVPVVDGNGNEKLDQYKNPVMRPTYTVMKIATKDGSPAEITVDKQKAEDYAKYTGSTIPVGQKLTILQDNALSAKMVGVRDAASVLAKANGKPLDKEQLDSLRTTLDDSEVQHALNSVPGDAIAGIKNALDDADKFHIPKAQAAIAAAQQAGDQNALAVAQKGLQDALKVKADLQTVESLGFNDRATGDYTKKHGDLSTSISEMEKSLTSIKSDEEAAAISSQAKGLLTSPALTQEQRTRLQQLGQRASDAEASMRSSKAATVAATEKAKEAVGKGEMAGDTSLQGQPYLDSIDDIGLRNALTAVAEGREIKSPRQLQDKQGNLTIFAKQLHQAFPDIDIAKASAYQKNVQEWTSDKTGTAGGKLDNGATALKHLKELDALFKANPNWTKMPQSEAYVRYNNLKDTLADELMKFYGAPSTTEVIDAYKSTIASFFNREAAISEQAKAMAEKFGSMEQTWNNISPRPSFHPPMPKIDNDAKAALQYFDPAWVTAHPQFQVNYNPAAQATGGVKQNPFRQKTQQQVPPQQGSATIQ